MDFQSFVSRYRVGMDCRVKVSVEISDLLSAKRLALAERVIITMMN